MIQRNTLFSKVTGKQPATFRGILFEILGILIRDVWLVLNTLSVTIF